MTPRFSCSIARALALVSSSVAMACTQTQGTGAIQGTAYDPADRVLSRAKVFVENEPTHADLSAAFCERKRSRIGRARAYESMGVHLRFADTAGLRKVTQVNND